MRTLAFSPVTGLLDSEDCLHFTAEQTEAGEVVESQAQSGQSQSLKMGLPGRRVRTLCTGPAEYSGFPGAHPAWHTRCTNGEPTALQDCRREGKPRSGEERGEGPADRGGLRTTQDPEEEPCSPKAGPQGFRCRERRNASPQCFLRTLCPATTETCLKQTVSRIGLGGWLKERKIIPPTGIMKGFV